MHPKPEDDDDEPLVVCGDSAAKRHGSRSKSITLADNGGPDGGAETSGQSQLMKDDTSHNLIQLDA